MTTIHFLHGAYDRLQAAVAWLAQRSQGNAPALVYFKDEEYLMQLDRQLWTQSALGFIPHCKSGHRLQSETPIILATDIDAIPHDKCLVNLTNDIPPGFSRFTELVEIISTDDSDRLPARERFRHYRDQGHELKSIDISKGIPA